jgi:hypothetical protein
MRGSKLVALTTVLLLGGSTACFVQGRCRTDDDCASPLVCGADRQCVLECRATDDCELEELCEGNRCVPAPGCAGCSFAHADAICTHGDCSRGDCFAGWVDANGEAGDGCEYACTPAGAETCNGADDDCDTRTDEDFDLSSDPEHCGACDNACPVPPHASAVCDTRVCWYVCDAGWYDNNGEADDGCEGTTCLPSGDEVCDGRDNDCDGSTDEGFDHTLPESCGPRCTVCAYDHAAARCVDGRCAMGDCADGWHDINGSAADGCEYECTPTGAETCNDLDDDCDGETDEGILCCPPDMVAVTTATGSFCIDIWEASRPDATDIAFGIDPSYATSRPGVLPWPWGPTPPSLDDCRAACAAAGKRLCNASEWVTACRGPRDLDYCYGNTYEPETCNGIDTFGRSAFHYMPTGSFPLCTNEYGTFDINGNVWELADDGQVRGGAYNCSDSAFLHRCSFATDPRSIIAVGFRCCR